MSKEILLDDEQIRRVVCPELTKPLPVYSHATVYRGIAQISAVQGFIPGTFTFPEGGLAEEADQMIKNLLVILRALNSNSTHILKMSLFFIDLDNDFVTVNEIVNLYIPDHSPARSSIGVAALPRRSRVVVDCSAIVNGTLKN